jgi:hypothetical protein
MHRGRGDGIRDAKRDCGSAGATDESAKEKLQASTREGFLLFTLIWTMRLLAQFLRPAKEN